MVKEGGMERQLRNWMWLCGANGKRGRRGGGRVSERRPESRISRNTSTGTAPSVLDRHASTYHKKCNSVSQKIMFLCERYSHNHQ